MQYYECFSGSMLFVRTARRTPAEDTEFFWALTKYTSKKLDMNKLQPMESLGEKTKGCKVEESRLGKNSDPQTLNYKNSRKRRKGTRIRSNRSPYSPIQKVKNVKKFESILTITLLLKRLKVWKEQKVYRNSDLRPLTLIPVTFKVQKDREDLLANFVVLPS